MVILTNAKGNEIRPLEFNKIDIDLNEDKTFEMTIPLSDYRPDLTYGNMIFIPDSEYGGIIGKCVHRRYEEAAVACRAFLFHAHVISHLCRLGVVVLGIGPGYQ